LATTLVCGLECQKLDANAHLVAGDGTPAFETTLVAPGGSGVSLKIACTGTALDAFFPGTAFSSTIAVARFRMMIPSFTAGQDYFLGGFRSASNNVYIAIEGSSGKFALFHQLQWATRVVSNVVAVAGQWYTFDLRADYSATPSANWRIDGATQTTLPSGSFQNSGFTWTNLVLGQRAAASGDPTIKTLTSYYDDVAVSLTSGDYPLSHGSVRVFVPSADGTHNTGSAGNFTDASATNITNATTTAYTFLDEIPPTTTDRVEQRLDTSALLRFGPDARLHTSVLATGALDALGVWRAATAASAAGQAKLRDNLGSTDSAIVNTTIAVTTDTYWRAHFAARPAALGAWTPAALQDLRARVGFGTDVTPDIWFGGVLVEAAFPPMPTELHMLSPYPQLLPQ